MVLEDSFFFTNEETEAKVALLATGRARTMTQLLTLSTEAFSSHNNGVRGFCRGERPGTKVGWIHHAQWVSSKEVHKMNGRGEPKRTEYPPPSPLVMSASEAQVGFPVMSLGRQRGHTKKGAGIKQPGHRPPNSRKLFTYIITSTRLPCH